MSTLHRLVMQESSKMIGKYPLIQMGWPAKEGNDICVSRLVKAYFARCNYPSWNLSGRRVCPPRQRINGSGGLPIN